MGVGFFFLAAVVIVLFFYFVHGVPSHCSAVPINVQASLLGYHFVVFLHYYYFFLSFVRGSHRIEIVPGPMWLWFRHTPLAWKWVGAGSKVDNTVESRGEGGGVSTVYVPRNSILYVCACTKKKKKKDERQQGPPFSPLTLPMKMITTEEGIRGRDCVRVPATHLW